MTRITSILNQKGGVGKSTTAHALATGLNHRGYKALVVDADPQGNISFTMQADDTFTGLYEALKGLPAVDAIQTTPHGDLISSSLDLSGADMEFTQTGREYMLKELIEQVAPAYSHVIIDCPPALGILSVNALTASNDVVIPIGADIYSLQGLKQLLTTIDRVHKYSNHDLQIAGLLITRKGQRATAMNMLSEAIKERAGSLQLHLYGAIIREAVAVKEAQIVQQSLFDSHPKAKVTEDYSRFIDEYLQQQ